MDNASKYGVANNPTRLTTLTGKYDRVQIPPDELERYAASLEGKPVMFGKHQIGVVKNVKVVDGGVSFEYGPVPDRPMPIRTGIASDGTFVPLHGEGPSQDPVGLTRRQIDCDHAGWGGNGMVCDKCGVSMRAVAYARQYGYVEVPDAGPQLHIRAIRSKYDPNLPCEGPPVPVLPAGDFEHDRRFAARSVNLRVEEPADDPVVVDSSDRGGRGPGAVGPDRPE